MGEINKMDYVSCKGMSLIRKNEIADVSKTGKPTLYRILSSFFLVGILFVAACTPQSTQKREEVTITLHGQNDSGEGADSDLPPFGPDVQGNPDVSEAVEDTTNTQPLSDELPVLSDEALSAELAAVNESQSSSVIVDETALPQNTVKTKIAVLLPLSAPDKDLRTTAKNLMDASLLALFDQRNSSIELIPYDTLATMQGAAMAAEKAVSEGAQVILGPLLSQSVEAAAIVARRSNVPMLTFNNRLDAAGNGVYILGNSPRFEVEAVMDYARSNGVRRMMLLAPDNQYGAIVAEAARGYSDLVGLNIAGVSYYNPTATDFTELTKAISHYDRRRGAWRARVKELEARDDEVAKRALAELQKRDTLGDVPYDAIMIAALDQFNLRTLTAQLSQYEVDQPTVRLLGLSAWDDMGNLANEPQLVGSWYASHPDKGWNRFAKHFKSRFGYLPMNISSIAYEAVALSSILAGRDFAPDFSARRLQYTKGYQGVRGLFRLSRFGYAERLLAIKQI
ncbi:MAG: penicillin-binding protein activator, partial [Alphaproteobacteria bacterium]|nr:penicillin-binding protein activator [Alphaproteobacteria bacterium]